MENNRFTLRDGRLVKIEKNTGIYNIYTQKNIRKTKYNAFVESYVAGETLYSKIRSLFHKLQANNFQKHPSFTSKVISSFLTYVPRIKRDQGNFLDIGCNTGIFLSMIPSGWKKYGVEINDAAFKEAKKIKNISVSHIQFEKYHPKVKFDFIRASHVIEHLSNPDTFFKRIYKISNPKAKILIYTPNTSSYSLMIFGKYWACFSEKTHVKIFNINNLEKIAKKNGFKIIQSGSYPMGIAAGSIRGLSMNLEKSIFSSFIFFTLFLILYPFSIIANIFKHGSVLYLYLEKK
ncbi:MAG TPA: class I SAM-dependent methyltransferase [Spirochaetia bacterium]|nr:class I SAM-dependent methyltransferase [Spirochaetia bacterium]